MPLRELLRRVLPRRLLRWHQAWSLAQLRRRNRGRSARQIFSEIYGTAQWGGQQGEFCSGRGSAPHVTQAYCAMVRDYIREHGVRSVLDLGCGDFEVGKRIQAPGVSYIGIDVVEPLIERNRKLYATATLQFECLDIVADPLPRADLCLIRQVFQHLPNGHISAVLDKVADFPHVIVTEHYPAQEATVPNLDKPLGGDTRLFEGSAVYLDRPPFDRHVRLLLTTDAPSTLAAGESLRSFAISAKDLAAG